MKANTTLDYALEKMRDPDSQWIDAIDALHVAIEYWKDAMIEDSTLSQIIKEVGQHTT